MFQIITNSSLPNYTLNVEPKNISVPCFYLTNDNSSTSTIELSNFAPMFQIQNTEEESLDIEDFSYLLSSTPSEFQMLEINIEDLQPLDDISTLYLNGSKYQNLLDIEELILFTDRQDSQLIEEREST